MENVYSKGEIEAMHRMKYLDDIFTVVNINAVIIYAQ